MTFKCLFSTLVLEKEIPMGLKNENMIEFLMSISNHQIMMIISAISLVKYRTRSGWRYLT